MCLFRFFFVFLYVRFILFFEFCFVFVIVFVIFCVFRNLVQGYLRDTILVINFGLLPDTTDALGDIDEYLLDYIECDDRGSLSFSDYTFCDNFHDDNQTIQNSLNSVCCTASRSCLSSANITSSNIRCDGSKSCYLSVLIEILNPSVENAYISGNGGARDSKIKMMDGYGYADIHCRAAYSCGYSDIMNTSNIYFVASQAGWYMNSSLM